MGENTEVPKATTLPLVSVVIINWNYGAYIGQTIDSVKQQDYDKLEILVVDNGSSDDSVQIINKHIAGDKRFKILRISENLGQLGAFFDVYKRIHGEFVVNLDADDVLFPSFIATHVQAHLALDKSVALTSSDVTIIDKDGEFIRHGYQARSRHQPDGLGLNPDGMTVRLPHFSEEDYSRLNKSISVHHGPVGWIWGPGTANMYRRSVLDNIYERPKQRAWMRSSDNFLNPISHALLGTALIDQELSAYRVHGTNYYATMKIAGGGRSDQAERARQTKDFYETTESLLRRVKYYAPLLGDKYWDVLASVSKFIAGSTGKITLGSPETIGLIERNYVLLSTVFNEDVLREQLPKFFLPGDIYMATSRIGVSVTPMAETKFHSSSIKSQRPDLSGSHRAVRLPEPQPVTAGDNEDVYGYGPASVLSTDPPVFLSGIALREYIGLASAFGRRYGNIPAAFVIYPTWTLTTDNRGQLVVQAALRHQKAYPAHKLIFICNEPAEVEILKSAGLTAHLLNKNFMVSEQVFKPLQNIPVKFDSVYNARFTPIKRHELAHNIPRVAYISYGAPDTVPGMSHQNVMSETLRKAPEHKLINIVARGQPIRMSDQRVNRALNQASVGLCLSAAEGSNWASMEYLLSGLPIVSTPSIGGRDQYFDPEYCIVCDPTPGAVADAVEELKKRAIPREYIRESTLKKIEPQRQRFLKLIDDASEELGGSRRHDKSQWPYTSLDDLIVWQTHTDHLRSFERKRTDLRPGGLSSTDGTRLILSVPNSHLQPSEVQPIIDAIESRPYCRLLVFGCTKNSVFWEAANPHGTTVFIESDAELIHKTQLKLKNSQIYDVIDDSKLSDWPLLLKSPNKLQLELPDELSNQEFDVILVDDLAKASDKAELGRMKYIYMASQIVARKGYVFIRDCDKGMEQRYTEHFLGSERLFVKSRSSSILLGYLF